MRQLNVIAYLRNLVLKAVILKYIYRMQHYRKKKIIIKYAFNNDMV
jgi:hypothetical protein